MMNPDDPAAAVRRRVVGGLMAKRGRGLGGAIGGAVPTDVGGLPAPSAPLMDAAPPPGGMAMDAAGGLQAPDAGQIGLGQPLPPAPAGNGGMAAGIGSAMGHVGGGKAPLGADLMAAGTGGVGQGMAAGMGGGTGSAMGGIGQGIGAAGSTGYGAGIAAGMGAGGQIGLGPALPRDPGEPDLRMGGWDNPVFGGPGVASGTAMGQPGGGLSAKVRMALKRRLGRYGQQPKMTE